MPTQSYQDRKSELETYFDRTALDGWKKLTSNEPVSGIRATVRAGRDQMRATLLSWLPDDLHGYRILDAGCGTGALSMQAALRGGRLTAVDISHNLIDHAIEKLPCTPARGMIDFQVGDMLSEELGDFDYVVAMDSLIHYGTGDIVRALAKLSERVRAEILFTVAPATTALLAMHTVGKFFPRADRAPAIQPVAPRVLEREIAREPALFGWRIAESSRVKSGFYISQAFRLVRDGEARA
ncbi:MAG: magnesium protoporphyrin IX methyltransferase [Pseudomonadota bacterium]